MYVVYLREENTAWAVCYFFIIIFEICWNVVMKKAVAKVVVPFDDALTSSFVKVHLFSNATKGNRLGNLASKGRHKKIPTLSLSFCT